jgi:hypothetical protein
MSRSAMIAALQLRLGHIPADRIVRLTRAEALLKYNFNPNQPRDWHGNWTTEGGAFSTDEASAADHPALVPAQELLPFGARPPLFFDAPPKTFRPFKEPIPRLSRRKARSRSRVGHAATSLCRRERARLRGALDGQTIWAR